MEDLSARYNIALTPSSQEGGNLIQPDLAKATMTAPGSEPVSPLPPPLSGSDPRIDSSGPEIPVSNVPDRPGRNWRPGGGRWSETPDSNDQPAPSPQWKQL